MGLVPRPRPAFHRLQYGNAEGIREVWGDASPPPPERFEFLSFLGRFWGYFRPYSRLESEALRPGVGVNNVPPWIMSPTGAHVHRQGDKSRLMSACCSMSCVLTVGGFSDPQSLSPRIDWPLQDSIPQCAPTWLHHWSLLLPHLWNSLMTSVKLVCDVVCTLVSRSQSETIICTY